MKSIWTNPAVIAPLLGASAGIAGYRYWKEKGKKVKKLKKGGKMKSAVVKKPVHKAKKGGEVPKKK